MVFISVIDVASDLRISRSGKVSASLINFAGSGGFDAARASTILVSGTGSMLVATTISPNKGIDLTNTTMTLSDGGGRFSG